MDPVDQIKAKLHLKPHPMEGGYFVETYRSDVSIPEIFLPEKYKGRRSLSTAIYYLLSPESCSRIHRLNSDEIFHFYSGDPVEMLLMFPDGSTKLVILGNEIVNGMSPQVFIPGGVWQGAMLRPGGRYALLGTTVSPGFDYADYELGIRKYLIGAYPLRKELIISLTAG
jgi:hypothetical protein